MRGATFRGIAVQPFLIQVDLCARVRASVDTITEPRWDSEMQKVIIDATPAKILQDSVDITPPLRSKHPLERRKRESVLPKYWR